MLWDQQRSQVHSEQESTTTSRGKSQTHYTAPFGPYLSYGSTLFLMALCILALLMAAFEDDAALAVIVLIILILAPIGFSINLVTSPSFGMPMRMKQIGLSSDSKTIWVIKPLFARKRCERVGGMQYSAYCRRMVDYDEPLVVCTMFGIEYRIRWEPALYVVDW